MTATDYGRGAKSLMPFVALAAALFVASTTSASAAEFNVRVHTNQPASENAYQFRFAKDFAERVERYTNGRMKISIFPGSQLGRDPEVFQQIQLGAVQMGIFAFPNVVEFYGPYNVFNMPYLFGDFDSAARAFMGPTAKKIYADAEQKTGVKVIGIFNGGFRGLTNSVREVKTVEDLKGLKIRVPGSPILIDTMKALGTSPVNISAGDLFTALQLRTVDGQESGVSWSFGQGYAEVQKSLTLTKHSMAGTGLFVNAAYFAKLPADVQEAVTKAALESVEAINAFCKTLDVATADKYRKAGLTVTELEIGAVRPLVKPVWAKYADLVGGEVVIEALVKDGETPRQSN